MSSKEQTKPAMMQGTMVGKRWMSPQFYLGILFTLAIASLGTAAANLPILNRIGAMLTSILIAVLYRNFWGYPERIRSGIQFSA